MTRLLRRSAALLTTLALLGACSDDGAGEDAQDESGSDEGEDEGEPDEPLFFPPGTVLVPAGEVWRGCLEGDSDCDSDEEPGGYVQVDAFFIDRFEVRVRTYDDCADEDACPAASDSQECNTNLAGRNDYPMNCMSHEMAAAVCAWRGMRLPTEAEWERAARGDALSLYPWGDDAPDCDLAVVDGCGAGTQEVGMVREGDSPFGAADMVGNVSEWVADYYDADYFGASEGEDNPQGPDSGSSRVLKGSAFTVPPDFPAQRISNRNADAEDADLRIYGVRCARDR